MDAVDISCIVCKEPYDDDPDQVESLEESHLPVQSSKCQHLMCYSCVIKTRLSRAESATDSQFSKTKWLRCPVCREKTSFNAEKPIVGTFVCELLRDRRRQQRSKPGATAASDDGNSSGGGSSGEDDGGVDDDETEEPTAKSVDETSGNEKEAAETAGSAEENSEKKKAPTTSTSRGTKTKQIPQVSGQKTLASFFGAKSSPPTAALASPTSPDLVAEASASSPCTKRSSQKQEVDEHENDPLPARSSSSKIRGAAAADDEQMILQPPSAIQVVKRNKTDAKIAARKKPVNEKPKNAKVWNKSLAMMIKEKKIRQEKDNITNFFKSADDAIWKHARKAIKAKAADEIYVARSGQIIGLPDGLDKRVERFCKQVITGDPEVYLSKDQNRYLKDNGKRSISIGGENDADGTPQLGGSFALLMAFHESDEGDGVYTTSELQKKHESICGREVAQKVEGMKGYACGVWTRSIGTLEKHGLVKRTERGEKKKLGREGSQDTYELTKDGEIFTKALIRYRGDEVKKYYRKDIQEEYFGGVESMKYGDLKSVAKKRRRLH